MAYQIQCRESIVEGVRRIAGEQLGKAIDELDDPNLARPETVHQVRKRCKKLRGLIRLVRPSFDGYKFENQQFRDAARLLSAVRDAQVHAETYDAVMDHFDRQLNRAAFGSIRRELTRRRKKLVRDETDLDLRLDQFRSAITEAMSRTGDWVLKDSGYKAVRDGFAKTYGRAEKALRRCRKSDAVEDFHELRKRAKYHWYHCRLLGDLWPSVLKVRQQHIHQLTDWLGDAHDLAVLADQLEQDRGSFGDAADVEALLGLMGQRRRMLESKSLGLGEKVFAESADAIASRMGVYWKAWKNSSTAW